MVANFDEIKGGDRRLLSSELLIIERLYPNMPLVPVVKKAPKDKGWQHSPKTASELIEVFSQKTHYTGFGVLLGYPFEWLGHQIALIAVDIDGEGAQEELDKILNGRTLERTVAWTSGRKSRSQHLYFVKEDDFEKLRTKKLKKDRTGDNNKVEMLELRWKGLQSVLPPSMHPTTGSYKWIRSFEEDVVEPLPDYFRQIMMETEPTPLELSCTAHTPQNSTWTDEEWASNYLEAIGSYRAECYDEWLKVGQALHSVSDSLLGEWDNWSRQSGKYKPGECEAKWRSFSPSKGIGIGTLAHYAKEDGWRSPFERQHSNHTRNTSTASIKLSLSLKEAVEEARKVLEEGSDELALNITLEDIRTRADVSSFFWEQKIMKPLKREIQKVRFKLELQRISELEDKVEQALEVSALAPKYCMSAGVIQGLLKEVKKQTTTPMTRAYALDELLELETPGLDFIVPGWLPVGETIILGGSPKAGKTLLSTDLAFAVVTGESQFLGEKVKQGKVLIVQADESLNSCKAKLLRRGFRSKDASRLKVLPQWNISQMRLLEEQLEDFRPDVVIIDSLRRINHGSEISENSAEFADNIYTLKEMLQRYGCSGVLIHHTSKDREALGVNRLRGSSAIAGSVWGVWNLDHVLKQDPENKKKSIIDPSDLRRTLELTARDSEGQRVRIDLNPENNSWTFQGDVGISEEEQGKRKTLQERILTLLRLNTDGLGGKDIIDLLDHPKPNNGSVYATLNRLVNRRQISSKSATGDHRYTIYFIPQNDKEPVEQQETPIANTSSPEETGISTPPPSPPVSVSNVIYPPETQSQQRIEIHNKYITNGEKYITSKKDKKGMLYTGNPDTAKDSEIDNISEAELGGGVCSEDPTILDSQEEKAETEAEPEDYLHPDLLEKEPNETVRQVAKWLVICKCPEYLKEVLNLLTEICQEKPQDGSCQEILDSAWVLIKDEKQKILLEWWG